MENSHPLPTETTDLIYGWVAIVLYALKLPYALTGVAGIPMMWGAQPGFTMYYGVTSESMRIRAIQLAAELFLIAIPGFVSGLCLRKGLRSAFVFGIVANGAGLIVTVLSFPKEVFEQMSGQGFFVKFELGALPMHFLLMGIIYAAFVLYCCARLTGRNYFVVAKDVIIGHFRTSLD